MPHTDCQCAVTFDDISLKSALSYNPQHDVIEGFENFGELGQSKYMATHALVFMARGLSSKWKQPVGYLSSGPITGKILHSLTHSCVTKYTNIGLSVKAFICDQGSNNRQFLETFRESNFKRCF